MITISACLSSQLFSFSLSPLFPFTVLSNLLVVGNPPKIMSLLVVPSSLHIHEEWPVWKAAL